MKKMLLLSLSLCLPLLLCAQGKLTAYYANCDFGNYKKGQLIVDTNDPINRMVDYSQTKYKFEGDDTGEYYSHLILKSRVTVKEYQMSPLPVELVKDDAVFVSNEGEEVRIFAASAFGHSFYSYRYNNDEGFGTLEFDLEQTEAHREYYALSCLFYNEYMPGGFYFEEPLEVEDGNIKLYYYGNELRYCSDVPDYVRYRPYMMGFLEEKWTTPEDYGFEKSAYDESGNLLVDVMPIDGIPMYYSIAYIGAEDALYIDGTLYYR